MAESICSTSSCPGWRRWPRNLLRMKEKNLRCKLGMIATSNFGNVNQDGTQEGISCCQWNSQQSSQIWQVRIAYGDYVMSCDHFTRSYRILSLIYHLEMIFINGRIQETIVHHILDCLSTAQLREYHDKRSIGRVYRISGSRTVEGPSPPPMRLPVYITWIGTPFGKFGALFRIRIIISLFRGLSEE
jgi:hypothetical protein